LGPTPKDKKTKDLEPSIFMSSTTRRTGANQKNILRASFWKNFCRNLFIDCGLMKIMLF
jgi:hypothetical protein